MGCGSSASVEVTEKSKSQTIPTARTTASNTANVQSNPMSKQQPLTIKTLDNTAEPRSIDIKIPIAEKEAVNAIKKSNSKPDDDDDEDDDEDDNDEDDDDEESDEDEDEKANENNKRIGTKSESFEAQLSVDRSKIDASKDPKTRNAELARAMREVSQAMHILSTIFLLILIHHLLCNYTGREKEKRT